MCVCLCLCLCLCVCERLNRRKPLRAAYMIINTFIAGDHRGGGDQRRHLPGTRVNVPAGLWWCTWAHLSRSRWPPSPHISIYIYIYIFWPLFIYIYIYSGNFIYIYIHMCVCLSIYLSIDLSIYLSCLIARFGIQFPTGHSNDPVLL